MKVSCNVIKDILPLYAENMASDDTRTLVEEHVSFCDRCKKSLEEMSIPLQISSDTNTAPMRKLKAVLQRKRLLAILISIMLTLMITVVAFSYLTVAEFIPYDEDIVSLVEIRDGLIIAVFSGEVSGYDINRYLAEDQTSYVYHITAWNTILNRGKGKIGQANTVLNPKGEKIAAVYYYSTDESEDRLIYGADQNPGGGIITLPRLFLSFYRVVAMLLAALCGIVMILFRRNEKVRRVSIKIFYLPVSYLIGHLLIKGFTASSYTATRDFLGILLVTMPLYTAFLLADNIWREYKENKVTG